MGPIAITVLAAEFGRFGKCLTLQLFRKSTMRKLTCDVVVTSPDGVAETLFERLREVYAIATAAHAEIYNALRVAQQRATSLTIEESVDCQFALRETAKFAEDTRKECNKVLELMAKLTCMNWAMDPNADVQIEGTCCTGSPVVKQCALLPTFDKDPAGYKYVMDYLGIPEDLRDRGDVLYHEGKFTTEVVKINWNGYQDLIDQWKIAGHVLPEEILSAKNSFSDQKVTLRKKRDLL